MTVSSETNKVQYNGNGAQDTFPYTFKIFADGDIVVVYTDASGNDTTWLEGTQYTVTNAGEDSGGNIVVDDSYVPPSGTKLTIYRQLDVLQGVDYVEGDYFLAETNEEALDRLTFIDQQQDRQLALSLKAPESDSSSISLELPTAASRANKFLAFDSNSEPIASAGSVDTVPVTPYMKTVLDDTTSTAAKTTLEVDTAVADMKMSTYTLKFGTSNDDLEISHDGSNGVLNIKTGDWIIKHNGTAVMKISSDGFRLSDGTHWTGKFTYGSNPTGSDTAMYDGNFYATKVYGAVYN